MPKISIEFKQVLKPHESPKVAITDMNTRKLPTQVLGKDSSCCFRLIKK